MTAVLVGGTRLRHELLSSALGGPVTWWRPAEAAPAVESARLVVLCPDTLAEQAGGSGAERLGHLRAGVLSSIVPLQSLAAGRRDWCRVVWTVSSAGLAGTADPVRSAIEYAALGAMRNVTREFAPHWSTAAVVLDGVPVEQRERRFAAAAALLADPATRFYSGQVMRLASPSGMAEAIGHG
jgi:hypothetical protein